MSRCSYIRKQFSPARVIDELTNCVYCCFDIVSADIQMFALYMAGVLLLIVVVVIVIGADIAVCFGVTCIFTFIFLFLLLSDSFSKCILKLGDDTPHLLSNFD